eukprot:3095076-Alexandrium_andersonii.AAC.1
MCIRDSPPPTPPSSASRAPAGPSRRHRHADPPDEALQGGDSRPLLGPHSSSSEHLKQFGLADGRDLVVIPTFEQGDRPAGQVPGEAQRAKKWRRRAGEEGVAPHRAPALRRSRTNLPPRTRGP